MSETLAPHGDTRLDAVDAFTGLDAAAQADALTAARERQFAAGDVVFHQDDEAAAFFIVRAGRIRMSKLTPDGQQVTVRYIGPDESFGCVAVCGGLTYPATAEAVEETLALGWTRARMQELAGRWPRIAMNVMRIMGGRLCEVQNRLGEVTYERVERRIARALARLAAQAGRRDTEGVVIDFVLSRQDLAEYAGSTLATVSRTLSRWEEEGIVALGRQRVVIRQPHRLVSIADDLGDGA